MTLALNQSIVIMTGKERVLATIAREPIDRYPVDYFATAEMEKRLLCDLKLADTEGLYQRLGADIFRVCPAPRRTPHGEYYGHIFERELDQGRYLDNWGITWQRADMQTGDVFYEVVDFPLLNCATLAEIEGHPWPRAANDWDFTGISTQIASSGNRAISGSLLGSVFDDAWRLTGLDRFLLNLALEPELCHAILRKVCNYWLDFGRFLLESAGGKIDLMWTSDDLGTQNGLLISREMCREFVTPLLRERVRLFKNFQACAVMHSCGGIYPVIPDLIACGVEVLNPIQSRCQGMDRKQLKQEFGRELVFHGSVDQQSALVFGSAQDVVKDTRQCLETLGHGGGYIVAPSHALETDISTVNVLALYETALASKPSHPAG